MHLCNLTFVKGQSKVANFALCVDQTFWGSGKNFRDFAIFLDLREGSHEIVLLRSLAKYILKIQKNGKIRMKIRTFCQNLSRLRKFIPTESNLASETMGLKLSTNKKTV